MDKKITASWNQVFDGIASQGNISHWGVWIRLLENTIESNREFEKPLSGASVYVAWMLMKSEYAFYRLRACRYVVGDFQNQDVFDKGYEWLLKSVATSMPPEIVEAARLGMLIRHILLHKGFPNLQDVPTDSGRGFNRQEITQVCHFMQNPGSYHEIKQRLDSVIQWIGNATPAFSAGF